MFVYLCSGKVLDLAKVTSLKFEAGYLILYDSDSPPARIDRREVLYCTNSSGFCPAPC
jgi:hypothetical protein